MTINTYLMAPEQIQFLQYITTSVCADFVFNMGTFSAEIHIRSANNYLIFSVLLAVERVAGRDQHPNRAIVRIDHMPDLVGHISAVRFAVHALCEGLVVERKRNMLYGYWNMLEITSD